MAMRMSGMMSGMDTESIIQQLVEAKSTKLNKTKKAQIKVNWKQDAWKELNTKLKNLQSKYLSNMRFSTAYSKKTTKVSNSSIVSVITGENAMNGVQSLQVKQLAKTGYLTGKELKNAAGNKANYTALTKLSDMGVTEAGTFNVKTASGSVDINVDGNTTISDVLSKLKDAGLNASFDTKNQRFFVLSKESGASNDFSLTASDANGAAALSALGLQVNLNEDKASLAEYQKFAGYYVEGDPNQTRANMQDMIDASVASRVKAYVDRYKTLQANLKTADEKMQELQNKYDDPLDAVENYAQEIETLNAQIAQWEEDKNAADDAEKAKLDEKIAEAKENVADLTAKKKDAEAIDSYMDKIGKLNGQIDDVEKYVTVTSETVDGVTTYSGTATPDLIKEESDKFYAKASYAAQVMKSYDPSDKTSTGATKVSGQDAIITLNGAEFTNNTNVFEINGLTFTALSDSNPDETVSVTTQNDTDGIYDMIKNFLKEYNSIINEMDKLYNASSAKGYEPLLSEEKEAMSDSEVEEYEKKIKDSILRRDSNLSDVSSKMRQVMAAGIMVNGKTMYLSDFGIGTLGYFSAPDNEKNAYHIDGDPDDGDTSGNADKLKSMIANDPDTVISFFTKLSQNLYGKMSDMSKSINGYRSFGSFYDDKKMKSDYDNYASKIKEQETKLNAYEDKWYKKFAKMETALAKMQKNATAVTGLLGGQ
ncbi:MAG: flagellar filament capping protein FliD [Acetatifactor sp.]|nr:flagellar filament capping protein FliD [Acetatifactor sp.]